MSKKKKGLYSTNTVGNFQGREYVIFFIHVTNDHHLSFFRKQNIKEMGFVKKQILFKFLNDSWIGFPKQLNGKLFVFCDQYYHLNLMSLNDMILNKISFLGVHWESFYFSNFMLTSIKSWNDLIHAKNLTGLVKRMKIFFFQKISNHASVANFLAKSLFFFKQTIYFKIFLCRA